MSSTDYEERQRNEIQALKSIFSDEFSLDVVPTKSVWNRQQLPNFSIYVRQDALPSDVFAAQARSVYVKLQVQYTLAYPRTLPLLRLSESDGLSQTELDRMNAVMHKTARECLGTEMIYEVIDSLKVSLNELTRPKSISSLNEERDARLEVLRGLRSAEEHQRQVIQAQIRASEESAMRTRIEVELRLQHSPLVMDPVSARPLLPLTQKPAHKIRFNKPLRMGAFSIEFVELNVPIIAADTTMTRPWLVHLPEIGNMVVKEFSIEASKQDIVRDVECSATNSRFIDANSIHGPQVENYGLTITVNGDFWTFFIAQSYVPKGSLKDLLATVAVISIGRAKRWLIDLAEQLLAGHRRGLVHRYICPAKVLLMDANGRVWARLCDWDYSSMLHKQDIYYEANRMALTDGLGSRPSGRTTDDVIDICIIFLEMVFGQKYRDAKSVEHFLRQSSADFDDDLSEFLTVIFQSPDHQQMTASDLLSLPYLRFTDPPPMPRTTSSTSKYDTIPSRYSSDFEQLSSVGRGAYGTVVRAKNRLDGRVYAIKKIMSMSNSRVLREVSSLARLNHPSIVRYFTSWVETGYQTRRPSDFTGHDSGSDSSSESISDDDFMSSSNIIFAHSRGTGTNEGLPQDNFVSHSRSSKDQVLFIQMEYCSGNTLRSLIDNREVGQLYWNYFTQIVEGVKYIHVQGLIHRDLKPANIFISREGQVKLGDFGLVMESALHVPHKLQDSRSSHLCRDDYGEAGTFFYQAPELLVPNPVYDRKVDLYALGIILAELTFPYETGMERISSLRGLRSPDIICPHDDILQSREVELIKQLLAHDPTHRPNAEELATLLPIIVDETQLQNTLKLLTEDEAFKADVVSHCFEPRSNVAEFIYDAPGARNLTTESYLVSGQILNVIMKICRRHGAIDRTLANKALLPYNTFYDDRSNAVRLMDESCNVLQLPFDFKLPLARELARHEGDLCKVKSFLVGHVYRKQDRSVHALLEADFDIIAPFSLDDPDGLGVHALRVMYEIIREIDELDMSDSRINLGHELITRAILDQARVALEDRRRVQMILSSLASGPQRTSTSSWRKVLANVVSESCLLELLKFMPLRSGDFKDDLYQTLQHLQEAHRNSIRPAVESLLKFQQWSIRYGVLVPIYFQPFPPKSLFDLSYTLEYGSTKVENLGIGGTFNKLISRQRVPGTTDKGVQANGFCLSVDKLIKIASTVSRRSDLPDQVNVIIYGLAHEVQATELVLMLWDASISAELYFGDDLAAHCTQRRATMLVTFKDKRYNNSQQVLKVRKLERDEVEEILVDHLTSYLTVELANSTDISRSTNAPKIVRRSSIVREPEIIFATHEEHRRIKLSQRTLISAKAVESVQHISTMLDQARIPILIVEFEADQMQVLRMFNPRSYDDTSVRKICDQLGPTWRAHFHAARKAVGNLHHARHQHVFVYSFRCSDLLLWDL